MEELNLRKNVKVMVGRYRYVLLVVLFGLGLMMIPSRTEVPKESEKSPESQIIAKPLEEKLEAILEQIEGAGRVAVLLTEHTGSETNFQTNVSSDIQSENTRENSDTVIVEDAARQEQGLIRRIDAPIYRGALVACQGAASAQVRLDVVEAVRCVTGLRADQITVVKMK